MIPVGSTYEPDGWRKARSSYITTGKRESSGARDVGISRTEVMRGSKRKTSVHSRMNFRSGTF